MAAVTRTVVSQDGDNGMTNKTNNSLTPVAQEAGGLPARTNKTPVAHQAGRSNGLHARRCYVGLGEVPGWRRLRAPSSGARNSRGSVDAGLFRTGRDPSPPPSRVSQRIRSFILNSLIAVLAIA